MRIIAGRYKGRRLVAPKGHGTRPTPDRVKESLFSMLAGAADGAAVLDLFAGTGALGLEALSRGAAQATFVEPDRDALVALRQNLATLGPENTVVLAMPAARAISQLAARGARFDLVFLDPPFALGLLPGTLSALVDSGVLLPHATIVCEHSSQDAAPVAPAILSHQQTRAFGDVALSFFVNQQGSAS